MRPWRAALVGAALGIAFTGCAERNPGDELRAVIAAAELAVEARDTGFFRAALSTEYVDAHGQRRDDLVDSMRAFFLANQTIEVLNHIDEIVLAGDDAATVVLRTAVVGRPEGRSLLDIDADFYRLELELVREDDAWRVIGAEWQDE